MPFPINTSLYLPCLSSEIPERSSAEKSRRQEALAVDDLSLSPRAASPSFLSPHRISLPSLSLPSLSSLSCLKIDCSVDGVEVLEHVGYVVLFVDERERSVVARDSRDGRFQMQKASFLVMCVVLDIEIEIEIKRYRDIARYIEI